MNTQSRVQEGPQYGLQFAYLSPCPGIGLQPPEEERMLSSDLPPTHGVLGAPSSQGRHTTTVPCIRYKKCLSIPASRHHHVCQGKKLFATGQALALTHCAEHCAAEVESTQEGPVCFEPLGLHLLQMLTQGLSVAFHLWGEIRVVNMALLVQTVLPNERPRASSRPTPTPIVSAALQPGHQNPSSDPAAGAYRV